MIVRRPDRLDAFNSHMFMRLRLGRDAPHLPTPTHYEGGVDRMEMSEEQGSEMTQCVTWGD